MEKSKLNFLFRNILKSLAFLVVFVIIYLLGKHFIRLEYLQWLDPIIENKLLILIIFLISEVLVGLLPPEIFIMWALQFNQLEVYLFLVGLLSAISYTAGLIGYTIGSFLNRSLYFRYMKARFLRNLDRQLKKYGIFLILVAALTPLPFSGVCMLVGSIKYSFRRLAFVALARFVRFGIYAFVFWEANLSF